MARGFKEVYWKVNFVTSSKTVAVHSDMSSLVLLGKTKNIPLAKGQVQYIKFTDAKFGEYNIERHMSEAQKELFLPQFRYTKNEARSIYN